MLLCKYSDCVLIGSFGLYIAFPKVLDYLPKDADLFAKGDIKNLRSIIKILEELNYEVFSWQDKIDETVSMDILMGRYYVRGVKMDNCYEFIIDVTYEIEDINFADEEKNSVIIDEIKVLNKDGFIRLLEKSEREKSINQANKIRNIY